MLSQNGSDLKAKLGLTNAAYRGHQSSSTAHKNQFDDLLNEMDQALMFSTQLQLKFTSIAEAKIAAQSLCELLKSRITTFNLQGLQVTVGKGGDLAISVRFDEVDAMVKFEEDLPTILEDIKTAFVFKSSRFSGVCVLSFEREAMSTSINIGADS